MHPVLAAFLAGVVGGPLGGFGAAIVGATLLHRVGRSARGGVLAFSGGFILAVAFLELIARGIASQTGWAAALVPSGFVVGAGLRAAVARLFSDKQNEDGTQEAGYRRTQARKLALTLAAENTLEGLSVGVAFAFDLTFGLVIAAIMSFDTFAEGLAVSTELAQGEPNKRRMFWLTVAPTPLLGVGAAIGAFLGELSPLVEAGVFGMAAGIMIHAVVDDIIYDATHLGRGAAISLPLVAGVALGTVTSLVV